MIANTPQYPPLKTLEGSRVDARPKVAASEQIAVATEAGSSWQCNACVEGMSVLASLQLALLRAVAAFASSHCSSSDPGAGG